MARAETTREMVLEQTEAEVAAAAEEVAVADPVLFAQARKALDRASQGHRPPGRNTKRVVRTGHQ